MFEAIRPGSRTGMRGWTLPIHRPKRSVARFSEVWKQLSANGISAPNLPRDHTTALSRSGAEGCGRGSAPMVA